MDVVDVADVVSFFTLTRWHLFSLRYTRRLMNIERFSLSQIKPYPNNPRKNKKGIAAVKRSIEAFGFTQPIIVNAEQVILCGHTQGTRFTVRFGNKNLSDRLWLIGSIL